jgi:hypothetical protein
MPSIILKKDEHVLHPIIDNSGIVENYNETKERQKKLKKIKKRLSDLPLKKSTITKEQFLKGLESLPKKDRTIENEINLMNYNDINQAEPEIERRTRQLNLRNSIKKANRKEIRRIINPKIAQKEFQLMQKRELKKQREP